MRRREFIGGLGGVLAASPFVVHAQQPSIPVVGLLGGPSPAQYARYVSALGQGLREVGYVEGHNVTIVSSWADGHYDRLEALAAELVDRQVAVILPIGGAPPTVAAKKATSTIPIVFNMGADPVDLGLVTRLSRPGGNVTGVAFLGVELEAKRLELLRELLPNSPSIGMLVNPDNVQTMSQSQRVQAAARAVHQQVVILRASTEAELETVFATLAQERVTALVVGVDTFFTSQPVLLATLAARYRIPAIYGFRSNAEAGGLMSYGASLDDSYRQQGVYAGRVLKGEKPADLPVQQSVKFELVINLKTAKALGLTIPETLLATADEVIQ
jgi:putative tryptophan/tyrosine transport system substrate-binding protein